jgi:hypothetical protein
MKRLGVVILVVVAAGVLWRWQMFSTEKRTCSRMAELCNAKAGDLDRCVTELSELRKRGGDEIANRLHACVHDAQSCAQSSGCLIGADVGAAGSAVGDFFKGIGDALKKR